MIMCLGLKSTTIYLPFYNLIKEVNWNSSVRNAGRDSVFIKTTNAEGETVEKQISKNDSIDVEIEYDSHQEVKIKILIKSEQGEFLQI